MSSFPRHFFGKYFTFEIHCRIIHIQKYVTLVKSLFMFLNKKTCIFPHTSFSHFRLSELQYFSFLLHYEKSLLQIIGHWQFKYVYIFTGLHFFTVGTNICFPLFFCLFPTIYFHIYCSMISKCDLDLFFSFNAVFFVMNIWSIIVNISNELKRHVSFILVHSIILLLNSSGFFAHDYCSWAKMLMTIVFVSFSYS